MTDGRARRRVLVYYPSFAHWGGAERLALQTAAALAADHDVVLCAEHVPPCSDIASYFGIDLEGVEIDPLHAGGPVAKGLLGSRERPRRWQYAILRRSHGRQLAARDADAVVSVEPSPPIACRHPVGVYSCFFPAGDATESYGRGVAARAYHLACRGLERALLGDRAEALDSWAAVIAVSEYTAEWVERLWQRTAYVVHPPCEDMGPPGEKRRSILSVGRFQATTTTAPTKSFAAVIDAFRLLCERANGPVELHLAGHAAGDAASAAYVRDLEQAAAGLPVVFHLSIDRAELRALYRESLLFWLATGFGTDPEQHPGKQEHFGIVSVEAMSAGAIPLLHASGGSVGIIGGHGVGALWKTKDDLVAASLELLANDEEAARQSRGCVDLARRYTVDEFATRTRAALDAVLGRAPERSAARA